MSSVVSAADDTAKPVKQRFNKWLNRRIPSSGEITLTQRRIFILPSRAGVGFLVVIAGLLLAAVNYQNNMLFALTFVLLGLFLVSILHTYGNLSGLTLRSKGAEPVFCSHHAEFVFTLARKGKQQYHSISLDWPVTQTSVGSLVNHDEAQVSVFVPTTHRGELRMGRLRVQTWYPLGLMRAWTWLDFNCSALVYPAPLQTDASVYASSQTDQDGEVSQPGGVDEFAGFTDYQPGDALNRVSWKHVARGLPPMSKRFLAPTEQRLWIDWDHYAGLSVEQRLSHMCFQVLNAVSHQLEYGLRLPDLEIKPDTGDAHQLTCLRALALFETPGAQQRVSALAS